MKTSTVFTIGFFGGIIIGGAVTLLEVAPKAVAILMAPLKLFLDGLRPYPSESPANFAVAMPLMLIYWGCLGAFSVLLLRSAFRILKGRNDK